MPISYNNKKPSLIAKRYLIDKFLSKRRKLEVTGEEKAEV